MPNNSLQTILTVETRDNDSEWSEVWSTTHLPTMDGGYGNSPRRREAGRQKVRMSSLVLGCLLTMHCRVSACALTGGYFIFLILLIPSMAVLASPLRHFEVYLGQWSISGPGRAFRIVPLLDGIGIAICINALFRSISCGMLAAIAGVYVMQGVSDDALPFTYCRDFDLQKYEPVPLHLIKRRTQVILSYNNTSKAPTIGTSLYAWRESKYKTIPLGDKTATRLLCNEIYPQSFPGLYRSPPYNYFYVEVMRLYPDLKYGRINMNLVWYLLFVWFVVWILLLYEQFSQGRLRWNNTNPLLLLVPCFWTASLLGTSVTSFIVKNKSLSRLLKLNPKQLLNGISDALEVSLYVHAASVGTEIILGKGLNHYASGHVDPRLNKENLWHSAAVLVFVALNTGASTVCALVDHKYAKLEAFETVPESSLWIIPMYSKCCSFGNYTHLRTTLLFLGLMISYLIVAFLFLKSVLHTIFEYRVKLVFYELYVVSGVTITCVLLSLLFTTNGGLLLLETIDSMITGIAMPAVCLFEIVTLLYVYGSSDFVSDLNLSTEENACSMRMYYQLHIIPIIKVLIIILKSVVLAESEYPRNYLGYATIPLGIIIIVIPLRSIRNTYEFFKHDKKRGV